MDLEINKVVEIELSLDCLSKFVEDLHELIETKKLSSGDTISLIDPDGDEKIVFKIK